MHIDIGIMRLIKFSAAYRIFSLWCSSSSFRFSSNQKYVNRKLYRPTYNKCRFLMAVNLSFTIFFFFLLFFLARSCFFARTASFLARTTFAFLKSKFNLIFFRLLISFKVTLLETVTLTNLISSAIFLTFCSSRFSFALTNCPLFLCRGSSKSTTLHQNIFINFSLHRYSRPWQLFLCHAATTRTWSQSKADKKQIDSNAINLLQSLDVL